MRPFCSRKLVLSVDSRCLEVSRRIVSSAVSLSTAAVAPRSAQSGRGNRGDLAVEISTIGCARSASMALHRIVIQMVPS
jgi:hypothetical protein